MLSDLWRDAFQYCAQFRLGVDSLHARMMLTFDGLQ